MTVDTIPQLFLRAASAHRKPDAFRVKKDGRYQDISHDQIAEWIQQAALGLLSLRLTKGDRIALLSESRPEWVVADLAILTIGGINVPIYTTLPAAQILYILKDSESKAIFVSDANQLAKIMEIWPHLPSLKYVICFDTISQHRNVLTIEGLLQAGRSAPSQQTIEKMSAAVTGPDWASIIYTSGTTGDPKGVILTHGNFVGNATTCSEILDITITDQSLSFLPLSHSFERTAGYYALLHGGCSIAYAESFDTVLQDIQEIRPTLMTSVPRVYEKLYARIMDTATSGSFLKKAIFFWALAAGRKYSKQKLEGRIAASTRQKNRLANRLVFSKLKEKVGGRLRFFVSGGAPLHREIAEFFHAAGLPIMEGYGLTETSPVIAVNTFEHFKFGTVGRAIPGVKVRIGDDGEILIKGPNVMLGYYKQQDLTSEVIKDGWLHTGDIGFMDNDGFLSITDRKKDLIVTAGGKNIAPQPIENAIKTSKYIAQVVLIGNRRKFISALIVPNFDNLKKFAVARQISYADYKGLLKHPKVVQKFQDEIARKSMNFASFEQVQKFVLLDRDFSIEGDELTPSLKVKRTKVESRYRAEIDRLYEEAVDQSPS